MSWPLSAPRNSLIASQSPRLETIGDVHSTVPERPSIQPCPSVRRLTGSSLRIDGLVILFFLALTALMLYPLSVRPATMVTDPGDPLMETWMLAWGARALFTDPLHFYDSNIFYPFPHSFAFSEAPVGAIPFSAPVWWITGNPVLAHNIAFLAAFFLSCVGAYLLTKKLTSSVIAGVFAGVIFAFPPYRFGHLSHLNLSSAYWMPVALLFLHLAFARGRWLYFLGFAGAFVFQCFCSIYYGFYFATAIALYLVYLAIFKRSRLSVGNIGKFAAVSLLAGIVLVPFGLPFAIVSKEYGLVRGPREVKENSADLVDYLVASRSNVVYGPLTQPLLKDRDERTLFPGLLPPLLALIGIWGLTPSFGQNAPRPRSGPLPPRHTEGSGADGVPGDRGYYVLLAAFAFLLSLGPRLQVGGKELELTLPYGLLYSYVPGFNAFRCPARFDVLVMLGLAVLAGHGIARMENLLTARGDRPPALVDCQHAGPGHYSTGVCSIPRPICPRGGGLPGPSRLPLARSTRPADDGSGASHGRQGKQSPVRLFFDLSLVPTCERPVQFLAAVLCPDHGGDGRLSRAGNH
jgi:hypothetical protein